ncbi:hypothetical protein RF11_09518 [Thelohanellus kitauei]|uniref:Uncharacterized protein n=1 Tax=Thelohanellus kitauei TaxID=669202 RepID=A0A0C2N194_THEKT|nr:hypothetical protein RF11_09518 [Thelohanellus kitauei]
MNIKLLMINEELNGLNIEQCLDEHLSEPPRTFKIYGLEMHLCSARGVNNKNTLIVNNSQPQIHPRISEIRNRTFWRRTFWRRGFGARTFWRKEVYRNYALSTAPLVIMVWRHRAS